MLNINRLRQPIPSHSINSGRKVMALLRLLHPFEDVHASSGLQSGCGLLPGFRKPLSYLRGHRSPSPSWREGCLTEVGSHLCLYEPIDSASQGILSPGDCWGRDPLPSMVRALPVTSEKKKRQTLEVIVQLLSRV